MEIKKLKSTEDKLIFEISPINAALANTLRRLMLVEVPTLAIQKVNFIKNTSPLYDEIIAHRLGLIPLKTDLKSYNLQGECKCKGKGCALCELKFKLKAEGPGYVYSSELKSKDPKCVPAYKDMPITYLNKGQKLELESTAVLDKGKKHIKFSPGLIYYKAYPVFEIDNIANIKEVIESCPRVLLKEQNKKVIVTDIEKCDLCESCVDASNKKIKIIPSKEKFIFYIESWGQLSAKEIMLKSLEIFEEKLDEFEKKLKKAK